MIAMERAKFKIYVRSGGRLRAKNKAARTSMHQASSPVAFVLRHISGMSYQEQLKEAKRLMAIVEMTSDDRASLDLILKSRCPKSQ